MFTPVRLFIIGLLVAAVGYAVWVKKQTPANASALSSIELSFTQGEFARTLGGWITEPDRPREIVPGRLKFFRRAIIGSDFLFIPAYVLLLAMSYWRLERSLGRDPSLGILALCAAAGAFDVLENVGILWLTSGINGTLTPALFPAGLVLVTSLVSAAKWAALTVVVVFVARAVVSGDRGTVLLLCRYSLLSIVLGTVPLIATSQGQDLVAALAETRGRAHPFFFLLALALWGLSVWYWSRVLLDAQPPEGANPHVHLRRALPHVLGFVTLLAPAYPLSLSDAPPSKKFALIFGCVSLAILFAVLDVYRRRWMKARGVAPVQGFSLSAIRHTAAFRIAGVSAVVSALLFVAFVGYPVPAGHTIGAIGILFIAAANTVFFGSVAVYAGKSSRVAVEPIALACAAVFSFWNDNHDVAVKAAQLPPPVRVVFNAWADSLNAAHPHHGPDTPVFIIAAEGGGIRAAYWTATVLSALNDAAPTEFPHHVFAINGISGGSLGAAIYSSLRADAPGTTPLRATAKAVFEGGYLAPVVSRLVTSEVLQWFLPVPVHAFDRSTALEDAFSDAYAAGHPDRFRAPFLDLKPSAAAGVPALALAGTDVDSGSRIVTAPFSWDRNDWPDVLDYHRATGGDPTLVAAVHNSARFTYVSPAGHVRTPDGASVGHVIDGGYFDPSGIETLADLTSLLAPLAAARHMRIVPIYISNSFKARRAGDDDRPDAYGGQVRPVEILGELFAPVRGLVRGRDAHAQTAERRARATPPLFTFAFCRPPDDGTERKGTARRMEPPLGWELSTKTQLRIDAFWDACAADPSPDSDYHRVLGLLKPGGLGPS